MKLRRIIKFLKVYLKKTKINKLIKLYKKQKKFSFFINTILLMSLTSLLANMLSYNYNRVLLLTPSIPKIIDAIIFVIFFYSFFELSKNRKLFYITEALFSFLFYIGSSIKYKIMMMPLKINDLPLVKEVIITLPPIYSISVSISILALALLLIINIDIKKVKKLPTLLIFPMFVLISISISRHVEDITNYFLKGKVEVFQGALRDKYKTLGTYYFLYYDYLHNYNLAKSFDANPKEIHEIVKNLYPKNTSSTGKNKNLQKRNIFFITAESLIDATMFLDKDKYSQDLFSEKFREIYNKTNSSVSVSTRTGTSNGIFELLCGFPIIKNEVVNNEDINNDLPCLPNILSKFGYTTSFYAYTSPITYNFGQVNKKIGFKNINMKIGRYKELNGKLEATYDYAVLDAVFKDFKKDVSKNKKGNLYYILTYDMHHPFTQYKTAELEKIINVNSEFDNTLVNDYFNATYYSTKIIADFIEKVFKDDPEALFIVTPDHPVYFTIKFNESGKDDIKYYHVPLIIIDGKDNYLKDLKMVSYNIPKKILEIIGADYFYALDYDDRIKNIRFVPKEEKILPAFDENYKIDPRDIEYIKKLSYDIFLGKEYYKKHFN